MLGRFIRAAAISIPGTTLSQLGMKTTASNACAVSIISQLSAIVSLLMSEYFIPA
jgi:hypothetical protein